MTTDTMRHEGIFDYRTLTLPIHVIGVGGVGSHAVYHIAKLGCGRVNQLHVWDDDHVEIHNLGNQNYDDRDVGKKKVDAIAEHALHWGCNQLIMHHERIDGHRPLEGIVFVCVDSMTVRKMLWDTIIKNNPGVTLMIECRMEATTALIHVIEPCKDAHIRGWEKYWYPDEDATNTFGCGGHLSVGPTASITADLAVWQMIRFAAIEQGVEDILDNQLRVSMRPLSVETFKW